MAIHFDQVVKALTTQSLLATLLERGGYRVTRLGIEELFGEIKRLEHEQYTALKLAEPLRFLPDLLIANQEMTEAHLVEVKYRRRFDDAARDSLFYELERQRKHWPQSQAVVMIGEPFVEGGKFHQDYIRVIPAAEERKRLKDSPFKQPGVEYTLEMRWNGLPMLHQCFRGFKKTEALEQYEHYVSRVLASLAKL